MSQFLIDVKKFQLAKYPFDKKAPIPYNGADQYLYNSSIESISKKSLLIINDEYGVLTTVLNSFEPISVSDSHLSAVALENNLDKNRLDYNENSFIDSLSFIDSDDLAFSTILLKIPKSVAYFEELVSKASKVISNGGKVFISGMVKHISKDSKAVIEKYFGKVNTGKVFKKAIIFEALEPKETSLFKVEKRFNIPSCGDFVSYSNTFSTGRLDKGTELLISSLPKNISGDTVDLGCGYGAISKVLSQNDKITLTSIDILYSAIAATKLNVPSAKTVLSDGLINFEDESIDNVISNPPFHAGTSFSVNEGMRLFRQVQRKLKPGGRFIMVANKGLNYKPYLSTMFSKVEIIAENKNYSVFDIVK